MQEENRTKLEQQPEGIKNKDKSCGSGVTKVNNSVLWPSGLENQIQVLVVKLSECGFGHDTCVLEHYS